MEYNKFIYKINKYKFYLRDANKKKKDYYQKKIDFYYGEIKRILNQTGGAFTDADLKTFIQPAINEINKFIDKKSNIETFKQEEEKYKENHKAIIQLLEELKEANSDLRRLSDDDDDEIERLESEVERLEQQIRTMNDVHRAELNAKLREIKQRIEERKRITYDNLPEKYKL